MKEWVFMGIEWYWVLPLIPIPFNTHPLTLCFSQTLTVFAALNFLDNT